MNSIQRRIENAERRAGIRDRGEPIPGIVVLLDYSDDPTSPHFAESVQEWLTRQKAQEEAEEKRVPLVFFTDPWREYELRIGLEPGLLAEHPLRGRVPFDQLLAAVTEQAEDQGKQPCTD